MHDLTRGRARAGRSSRAALRRRQAARRRVPLHLEALEARQMLAAATLNPVADTHARGGAAAGSAAVLQVQDFNGNDAIAYLRFDLSGLNIQSITSATLTLHKVASDRNDTITAARFKNFGLSEVAGNTPQNWSESILNGGALGAEYTGVGGNLVDATRLVNLDADTGASVIETVNNAITAQMLSGADLVAFLNARVAAGGLATVVSLVDAGADIRGWGYASRDNADTALQPTLTLEYVEADPEPEPEPPPPPSVGPSRQVEYLNRGVVAIRSATNQAHISWRLMGTDPAAITFNLYRAAGGGAPVKLNATPLSATTDFTDSTANFGVANAYHVRAVVNGAELSPSEAFTLPANSSVGYYLNVPLQIPLGGTTPSGEAYTYAAGDASVGDVDGDGQYEIILKWDPSNAKDNSQSGYTGNVYIDAYKLNGTRLWRIDLGRNIRAGAHYTQFMVYDFDGDGRAEVAMKTAPGTIDGAGAAVLMGADLASADYRNTSGYILTGPEYLTVFNGLTGAKMANVAYQPARGSVSQWGDGYGNRVDRFLGGVAYLDGVRPSLIMARGYYGPSSSSGQARNEIAAYDFRNGQLTLRWHFKAGRNINNNINSNYIGQGTHSLSIADVDGDGFDEVIYGAAAIDHNGAPMYATGLGHGDALHVSDMVPSRPGLEVYMPHEGTGGNGHFGASLRDARTGQILFALPVVQYLDPEDNTLKWPDVGRGLAIDVNPNNPGFEFWNSHHPDMYNAAGQVVSTKNNAFTNFAVWWDADPLRELLDGTTIAKWDHTISGRNNFDLDPNVSGKQGAPGSSSVNGTKATPTLSADLFGDWREEVMFRTTDNTALRIFTTPIAATSRMVTLMHDTQYRVAIAWQNGAYNQPPHPSFFLGAGMTAPPIPLVYSVSTAPRIAGDFNGDNRVDALDLAVWRENVGSTGSSAYVRGDADGDRDVDGSDFIIWQRNLGTVSTPPAGASASSVAQTALAVTAASGASNSTGGTSAASTDAAFSDLATAGLPAAPLRYPLVRPLSRPLVSAAQLLSAAPADAAPNAAGSDQALRRRLARSASDGAELTHELADACSTELDSLAGALAR